jgi:predicted PurR-regulated permease PerM
VATVDQFRKSILMLASIAIVVAALYLAKGLLIPLTLAVLLSFLLSPVCGWLERRGLGRIPAVLVTAILGFALLGAVVWIAALQMTHLGPKIPEYQANLRAKLNSVNTYAVDALGKLAQTAQGMDQDLAPSDQSARPEGTTSLPFSVRVLSSPASPLQVFGGMFGTLLEVLGTMGIVIVLVVFFLVRREDLRDRFIHLVGKGHVTVTTQMLEDAGARVSRYLSMLFIINVTFGISVGLGLYLIGVPNAILWGILAAALRFIPYIGPWIAAAMPIGLSMAISTGWAAPLFTIALFIVLELTSNNVLEPWLYGKNTGVSAVAVLVAAVFWMWLWGPVGLLLATPLTVCLLVVGKHVPQLSFLGILLGSEPVFEPKKRIYQRLLAGDQEEAAELIDKYLEHQPLVEVYDTVLIPALALAETHGQLGELSEGKHQFILDSLKEMIQDLGEGQQQARAKQAAAEAPDAAKSETNGDPRRLLGDNTPRPSLLCLPARDEADAIAALMLAQVLATGDRLVRAIPVASLATELAELLEQSQPAVICVSATPPAAVMHARYLCKRLRSRLPQVKLVVGLWDAQGDLAKAKERIGCGAIVVATLAEAQAQIGLLLPTHSDEPAHPGGPLATAITDQRSPVLLAGAHP